MRRQLIESHLYSTRRDIIEPDTRRLDDQLDGLTSAIAADAEQFFEVDRARNIWIAKTDGEGFFHEFVCSSRA